MHPTNFHRWLAGWLWSDDDKMPDGKTLMTTTMTTTTVCKLFKSPPAEQRNSDSIGQQSIYANIDTCIALGALDLGSDMTWW